MPSFRLAAHLFLRVAAMQAPVSQLVRYPGPSATKTSKCADQPHQLVHHRPIGETPRGPTLHSSQVKSSQVHPITTKESIQSQIREGQYLVFVHHSSRHTTRKQHLLTAEAFHLPARPVLREYSYRYYVAGTVVTRQLFRSTEFLRVVLIRSTIGTKFGETAVHFCTDTHEDVGPTVVDRR